MYINTKKNDLDLKQHKNYIIILKKQKNKHFIFKKRIENVRF